MYFGMYLLIFLEIQSVIQDMIANLTFASDVVHCWVQNHHRPSLSPRCHLFLVHQ